MKALVNSSSITEVYSYIFLIENLPNCSPDEKLLVSVPHCTVLPDDNPQGKNEHILHCQDLEYIQHFLQVLELTLEGIELEKY